MSANETQTTEPYKKPKTSLHGKLVSGAVAGIIGTLTIFPLDFIKTHLQASSMDLQTLIRKIYPIGGLRGFYSGLIPNLIGVTPEKAIKLAVNDQLREYFASIEKSKAELLSIKYSVMAGAGAGICQVIVTNPMEMVKYF